MDIYRTLHPKTTGCTFYASIHGVFPRYVITWAIKQISVNLKQLKAYTTCSPNTQSQKKSRARSVSQLLELLPCKTKARVQSLIPLKKRDGKSNYRETSKHLET
jgi:hypothetical protein